MGAWRRESRGRNLYGVFRCLVVLHTAQPFVTTLASRGWACLGGDSRCGVCIVSRDGPAVSRFGGGDCSACDAVGKKYPSPAGATALAAVIGGDAVTALGWSFVLKPVLLNAILLLIAGLVFNWPRKSHRYPVRAADTVNRDNAWNNRALLDLFYCQPPRTRLWEETSRPTNTISDS